MPLTLGDAAEMTNDLVVRGIMQTLIKESGVLRHLPFMNLTGTAITWAKEKTASTVSWHAVDGVPILDACQRWFVGSILQTFDLGDHVGFLLEPIETEQHDSAEQLTFQRARDIEPGHKP